MLVVDVGNTCTTLAAVDQTVVRLETLPSGDPLRVLAAVRAHLSCSEEPVAVASVVPAVGEPLLAALPGARPADHRAVLPFATTVARPEAVGADRYCNMTAAVAAGWRHALVVDAGTATTFDVLRDGVFVGGLIAPGLEFAGRALGERAARLDPVTIEPTIASPRSDTAGALAAGSYLVGAYGVLGLIAALLEGSGPVPVAFTGGLAPAIRRCAGLPPSAAGWIWDPDWTLRGAALLAFPSDET
jgi:type III pantothenate kinase